ncbi:Maestro Heat-Like Repeat-Containing Protein Family Member 9 [Manis pentadactyla]|nr:Maestro Heat-Like Repeat-Containing Protein Family Member 9 [Manis pentadactyla]
MPGGGVCSPHDGPRGCVCSPPDDPGAVSAAPRGVSAAPLMTPGGVSAAPLMAPGGVSAAPLMTPGAVSAAPLMTPGAVSAAPLMAPGAVSAAPLMTPGAVSAAPLMAPGAVSAAPLMAPGGVSAAPLMAPGGVSAAPLMAPGAVSAALMMAPGGGRGVCSPPDDPRGCVCSPPDGPRGCVCSSPDGPRGCVCSPPDGPRGCACRSLACQALCTLLPMKSYRKTVAQFFPQLLMALLLQLFYSSSLRLTTGERPLFAQDALRALLSCSGLQQVDCALERRKLWSQCSHELSHHHGVHLIAKTLSEYRFPQFPQTLQYLYKLSVEGPRMSKHSIITVTFLMELLNNFFKDPLPEEFMILFRNWVNDSNPAVCKLSLRKIASMAPVINEIENVCSLLISILDAFLSKDKTVVIQALFTLRTLLGKLDKVTYSSLCTRIASGYCPLMDHDSGSIRSMAVQQLGKLLRDMSQHKSMLRHVVLRGLVPLILFLEDTETRVVRACKFTLEICASELNWSMPHLLKDKQYSFDLVVLDICKNVLISHGSCIMDLIYDTLGFLRSSQPYLKRASIILIGYLTKLGGHLLLKDEVKIMLDAVDQVLQDEDPVIRELAEITSNIIKEIAHMLTSSIFKQSFRRLFNCIYIKKLKPLYNCDWSSKQSDGEALPYEAHEDFLTKSSRFTGAQGRTSEEGTHSSPS